MSTSQQPTNAVRLDTPRFSAHLPVPSWDQPAGALPTTLPLDPALSVVRGRDSLSASEAGLTPDSGALPATAPSLLGEDGTNGGPEPIIDPDPTKMLKK